VNVPQLRAENRVILTAIKVLIHAGIPVCITPEGDGPGLEIEGCEDPSVISGIQIWNLRQLDMSDTVEVFLKLDTDSELKGPLLGKKKFVANKKETRDLSVYLMDILAEWDAKGLVEWGMN